MIQGLPPHKCKAAQAREDEKKRADERAEKMQMQAKTKRGKGKETMHTAVQPVSSDSKLRKRDRAMPMPDMSTGPPAGGGGAQKKHRAGHYDRDGFLIPEVPLRSFKSVNSVY